MAEKGLQRAKTAGAEDGGCAAARAHGHRGARCEQALRRARASSKTCRFIAAARRAHRHRRAATASGKTTFLRVLLGELPPDAGEVVTGKNTRIAYYDQQRAQLDPEWTVYEAALGERIHGDVRRSDDFVELGERRVALRDYLDDLLFPVPMQRMQVKALSGGERNRLLLARLFLRGRERARAGRADQRSRPRDAERARAAAARASTAACCW